MLPTPAELEAPGCGWPASSSRRRDRMIVVMQHEASEADIEG